MLSVSQLLTRCGGLLARPVERIGSPVLAPAVFVLAGMVAFATIDAVRASNWYSRPVRDDSFLTINAYSRLWAVAISPNGQLIATAGTDHVVRIWDVDSGRELRTLHGHTGNVYSVAFSPDGRWLASGSRDRTARVWDLRTGRQLHVIRGHRDRVMALAISPDGSFIATGGRDHAVKIWDARTYEERASLSKGFGFVPSIAFHVGGQVVAFGDWFGSVRIWNHEDGQLRLLGWFVRQISGVAFSPDGRLLASTGYDHQLRLWDVQTGSLLHAFQGHTAPVTSTAFSPDRHLLASGSSDRTIRLWNIDARRSDRTLLGHTKGVTSIAFSPDGRYLASASLDETLRVWNIPPPEVRLKSAGGSEATHTDMPQNISIPKIPDEEMQPMLAAVMVVMLLIGITIVITAWSWICHVKQPSRRYAVRRDKL